MQNDQGRKNCEIQDGSQKMVVMADQCQKKSMQTTQVNLVPILRDQFT